uniref:Transport permease protein n=1 Tax=Desulfacinum infernum TaxID=35837 RepID=A0A832A6E6_9BACT
MKPGFVSPVRPGLILELTKRDFTERFAGSTLGGLWAFIWPLVNLMVYMVIFSRIMGARLPGQSNVYAYGVYLSAGLLPWMAFSGTFGRSAGIFVEKKQIISKLQVSLPSLLLYVSLAESVTFLISMGFFFGFLAATGWTFTRHLLLVPFIYLTQQVLAFGLGLLCASLVVFVRDLKEVVGVLLQLWFWFTPIVYVKDIVPGWLQKAMVFNPAYILADSYQKIFAYQQVPILGPLIVVTLAAHGITAAAYWIFRTLEKDIRDFL